VDFTLATGHIRIGKRCLEIKEKEIITAKMTESCDSWTLLLSNALWMPELDVNLIPIRQLAKERMIMATLCSTPR
jgi:hypothetical protein